MDIKERIKQRINGINDPKLLDELLKAVELESEIEHLEELTEDVKKQLMKEFLMQIQENFIQI